MVKKSLCRALLMTFCLLLLLLSACSESSGPLPAKNSQTHPVRGGTWIDDLYEEPNSLIPGASPQATAAIVDQAIYAPLFYGDESGVLHPGLATEIPTVANGDVSVDLTTWTFHLRPGLRWSDGQPEDARDVDFTWRLWTSPKFPIVSTVGLNLITSAQVSPNHLAITFHLKQGFEPFLAVWADAAAAPLPAHYFSNIAPDALVPSSDNLDPSVTSGPFMMAESKPGDHYTVVRNPHYYQAAQGYPYLDRMIFRVVTNQNTILADLQTGTIDAAWNLDVTNTGAYERLSTYTLSFNPKSTNFEAMYFDFRNPILGQHPEVRRAMAMAIDHQALIQIARLGQATPLCTDHAAALVPGYQPNAPCPPFDVQAANALLDRSGWVKGPDGVRAKGGVRLEFQYSTTNERWRLDTELILQQDLQAIGIKIDIRNYPASTLIATVPEGKYDLVEFEASFAYEGDDSLLFACSQIPPNGFNITFYCNHRLDTLFMEEQQTADPATRQQLFDQIHQIYLTDFPFITLYSPVDLAMHKKLTHNYMPGPEGAAEDNMVWLWWCDGGHC
ncbi:MAG TPA: peptide ABC transporter substrate-binding protein [Ktedonobacteraceae bacterium]|nr:peptide ABC transporter substrate-binding protein [Ktedonobacteraceae bacterium]